MTAFFITTKLRLTMSLTTLSCQATPPGRGGVGILRISGLGARRCARRCWASCRSRAYADYLPFKDVDGSALWIEGIALWFPRRTRFTIEDVLELQGHGGPVIWTCAVKTCPDASGVRIARPGEFSSERSSTDKLDLAERKPLPT